MKSPDYDPLYDVLLMAFQLISAEGPPVDIFLMDV